MNISKERMAEESLERIMHIQEHISAVEAAVYSIMKRDRNKIIDYGNLRECLINDELDEWRKLFMWGLTLDKERRDRIKAAAHNRFLRDGMHVANWINNGISPGTWFVADEAKFRTMAKAAFSPTDLEIKS